MYCRQKIKPLFPPYVLFFPMLDRFFLANLISILDANNGDLVKRGEKCLLLMSRFIGTHLELSLFILNFFPAKGAMDLNIIFFFFHKSAVHQKCRN